MNRPTPCARPFLACVLILALAEPSRARAANAAEDFASTTEPVGRGPQGFETPVNQRVTPAGLLIDLPDIRPQALALSPDGALLATSGLTQELILLDPAAGRILQRVPLPADILPQAPEPASAGILDPNKRPQLSFAGLAFSPDGSRIFMANVQGDIKVFGVGRNHTVTALRSLPLPPANAPDRKAEIPAGIAVSADGAKLYVALNLSNRAAELDAATGRVLRIWDVGVAPLDVALAGGKLYVSNWGGRRPHADSLTGPAGRGTRVRVDSRSIASEGSVSVIHLDGASPSEILAGLHAGALARSPDGRQIVVANAGSDTLSVIDTRSDRVIDTICARQNPGDPFGAQPDALAFDRSGRRLFVCNGTQNAIAVFQFRTPSRWLGLIPRSRFTPGKTRRLGLIPAGWFPGAIVSDAKRGRLCVASLKGLGPGRPGKAGGTEYNTKQYCGSLSLIALPTDDQLAAFTRTALADLRYPLLAEAALPPRPDQPARPVPQRAGEPSLLRHVIYVIKENRTYDQVLGDVAEGDGNPDLCTFGRRVTPNQHKLVGDFVLLDNTYCCGILSADGHQWADTAIATDYVEREFAAWPRSYPAGGFAEGGRDALAYSPAGFIWNDALAHGKTVRDFGEFTSAAHRWSSPGRNGAPNFLDCYRDFITGSNAIVYSCEPDLEALRQYIMTNTIGWDLDVPDVWRSARFIDSLRQFEAAGRLPDLVILWLPNDHTSGTKTNSPTPEAQVADNDLALGRVVEAVSRSPFWTNTCIFAVEDDPQDGWDHVSGYRTTAYVISPYTKRGQVIHTQYNQTSLLRTMELMLGLPPMNQMDATATPMFDCFTGTPDFSPFAAVPNQVPLDEMNPDPKAIRDPLLRREANISAGLPLDKPDQCPEDVLNRILWHSVKGPREAYPAWAARADGDDDAP
jgi:YVTN family beta-propeller protein